MTLQQLLTYLADYMPSATVTTAESGELVIRTGMCLDSDTRFIIELTLEEV